MNEYLSPVDNLAQAITTVNYRIGLADRGFPERRNLPREVDIAPIWALIARQETNKPFDREIFFGIDSIGGTLVCTEVTDGRQDDVEPEGSHLIGVHTHPRRGGINPFYDARPEVAPREMASMLDIPTQYAELIFRRSKGKKYPCVLAIKTHQAARVRYGSSEDLKQEFTLDSILNNSPFWRREADFLRKSDQFAQEKNIALYRGEIEPKSIYQLPLQLVR